MQIATASAPVDLKPRAGDDALYVVEKVGTIRSLRGGELSPDPVLDISGEVSLGGEQGLLGMDFSPDGSKFYINYTDVNGDTRIEEFAFSAGRADMATRRELLFVDQPFANHNGGSVVFGPDGMLYLGLGDGGSAGDPRGNGQSLGTLLGKLLRIDPRPSSGLPYTIPSDNPFVGREGARAEIWSYGLRNPWRFTFDRETRELWIGDVGQNASEEIDRTSLTQARGANFGWDLLEGSNGFEADSAPGTILPVHEYPNPDSGCSVTGGYVSRGSRLPQLRGVYLFADYCFGSLMGLRPGAGGALVAEELGLNGGSVSSLGQDAAGELYVLSLDGPIFRLEPA